MTPDFQGVAEVRLKLHVRQNGLVEQAEVLHATNAGLGEKLAATARTWIFLPFTKDGIVHPANTEVKLKVQAIKSKQPKSRDPLCLSDCAKLTCP